MNSDSTNVSIALEIPQEIWANLQQIAREQGDVDPHTLLQAYIEQGVQQNAMKVEEGDRKCYLLDTHIFQKLVDGDLQRSELPENSDYAITHLHIDEILNTSDTYEEMKRARLALRAQTELRLNFVYTADFVWGVSRWGKARLSRHPELFESLRDELSRRDGGGDRVVDAMLAATAIHQDLVLITSDRSLSEVAKSHECEVVLLEAEDPARETREEPNPSRPFFEAIIGLGESEETDVAEHADDILAREVHPIYGWSAKRSPQ